MNVLVKSCHNIRENFMSHFCKWERTQKRLYFFLTYKKSSLSTFHTFKNSCVNRSIFHVYLLVVLANYMALKIWYDVTRGHSLLFVNTYVATLSKMCVSVGIMIWINSTIIEMEVIITFRPSSPIIDFLGKWNLKKEKTFRPFSKTVFACLRKRHQKKNRCLLFKMKIFSARMFWTF